MELIYSKAKLSDVALNPSLRTDYRYLDYTQSKLNFKSQSFSNFIISISNGKDISPDKYVDFNEKSDTIYPTVNNFKGGQFIYDSITFLKEDIGISMLLENDDIIISRSGTVGLTYVWNEQKINTIFGREMIAIPSGYLIVVKIDKSRLLPEFVKHLFNSYSFQKYFFVFGVGKSQKNIAQPDILSIPIPIITVEEQEDILSKIKPLEIKVTNLENEKEKTINIINQVFSEEFNIPSFDIYSIDKITKLSVDLSNVSFRNNNLRDSFRWNKMQLIQNSLYKNIDCIKLLGNFLIETKNGWSPLSTEDSNGIPILGQEHFSFDSILKISPTKFTEDTKNNIEDYFIEKGDFLVSRGNTVDLVALASLVEEEISEDIIFPDLYIKIKFDETLIDKKYL